MSQYTSHALAKIVTSDGRFSYQLTDHDLLTLARSIRIESVHDRSEIAWCYVQRYAMLKVGGLDAYPTLASMIIAHSQPINPRWFPDGVNCRPGGPYHDDMSHCGQHAVNRLSHATIAWDRISLTVRSFLLKWSDCEIANPAPGAVDFRARDSGAERIISGQSTRDLIYMPLPTRNAFFATARSSRWPRSYVRLEVGRKSVGERQPPWWAYALLLTTVSGIALGSAGYLGKGRGRP